MQNQIFESEYAKLNENQKKAVDTIYGPVMVVAGPGTGKTQIIGLRTANIILQTGVNPGNILITTFTDAGVIAIKKRLEKFLGSEGYKVVVCTIHSFCQDVIKNFPEKFLQFKAGNAIDEIDSLELLKNILDKEISNRNIETLTNEHDRFLYLRDIKSRISTLKQEAVSYEEFEEIILHQEKIYLDELSEIKPTLKKYETTKENGQKHIKKLQELNYIYKLYNETLKNLSKYDFNDMINFVLEVLKNDEDLRYFYAEKFQFIMLDEFQDTNNAQNKIINLILSVGNEKPNILVVGDDDQSIYRFSGANIENMLEFSSKFLETQIVVLENNYRSSQPILDLCSNLINNNNERLSTRIKGLEKKLISSNPDYKNINSKPILITPSSPEEQKAFLLSQIKDKINSGRNPEEIAIIVRNNSEVEEFSLFFKQNQIEVVSKLNSDILKNDYVNFILKYLEVLSDNFSYSDNLIDITRSSIIGLNQVDIFKINKDLFNYNYTKKFKLSFLDYLLDIEKKEIELEDKNSLIEFKNNFLDFNKKIIELNFLEFFSYFIENIGIIPFIEKYGSFDDIEDIFTLFNKIKGFFENDKDFNISKFLQKINLHKEYNYSIPRQILRKPKTGINILTSHGSKGLEYETVFIPNLFTGNWDNKRVIDKLKLPNSIAGKGLQDEVDSIEEERRLFFVACSRAKKELYLSFPLGVDNKPKLASVFIGEINGYYEEINIKNINLENNFQISIKNQLTNNLIKYSSLEFDYINGFLENYKLSPTDLNLFLEDPLKFLQNVVFKYPFVDNDATIFGKVYHRVLELFYLKYKEKGVLEEVSYLTNTFKLLLEKEILSSESFENLLKKGIIGLEGFYETYKNNIREVLFLEYNFRPKGLVFNDVPITGKIDKIEKLGLTNFSNENSLGQLAFFKDTIAIIDYKTGKPKSLGEIKGIDKTGNKKPGEGKYFRQLMFYKLLCELDNEFNGKYEIGALALDFVEGKDGNYKYIEVPYTNDDYEYFKNELLQSREKISNIDFWKELLKK
ncbi:MAG: ATP-dependent DNA helicase [Candidatus Gracilibacteria bacterium]|nr:ATP-dependent DNA helicase [Candidatus Gracilibacteria bacterium]